MNIRDNALAVLHGEKPKQVPLLIDGDVMPLGAFEREARNKGLGICLQRNEYWLEQQDVTVETHIRGGYINITYRTPVGNAFSKVRNCFTYYIQHSLLDPIVKQPEYIIKEVDDYDAAIYIIEHTQVHPDDTPYLDAKRDIGEDGIVIGSKVETPYEALMSFLGPRRWVSEPFNNLKQFQKLLKAYEGKIEEMCKVIVDSPSEIVLIGSLCEPQTSEQFSRYYLPYFQRYAHMMHQKGKIVGIYARSLWLKSVASLIPMADLDFIEAFNPPPAGNLPLPEARKILGNRTVIWVNFPETVFWSGAAETRRYTSELIRSDAPGERLIIGLTDLGSSFVVDLTTRDLVSKSLLAITDAVNDVGIFPVMRQ